MKFKPSVRSLISLGSHHSLRLAVTLGAISYAGTSSLHADTIYWDGGAGSWNTVASWSAGSAATTPDPAAVPGAADDAIFNISTAIVLSNIALDADQSVNGLTFNNGKTTNLLGNTAGTTARSLTIGSGGITSADSARAVTLGGDPGTFGAVNIALGANQTWNTNSKAMTLNAPGVISGSANLTKTGNGTLALSGLNTFDGVLTVNNGTLSASSIADGSFPSPLGASTSAATNLLLGNFTTLKYTGAAASSDRSFTINGTAAGHGTTIDASGSGALSLSSTATPAYGTTNQTRTLTLAGTNTGNNTLSALIANNGVSTNAVTLAKSGKGTWVLNGSSVNLYTGGTTINGGTLALDFANLATPTNLVNSGSLLTLGGGTLALKGKDLTVSSQSFGNPAFGSQAGSEISITGGSGSTMDLILGNTWTRSVGSTLNVTLGAGGSLTSSPTTANSLVVGSGNIAFATVGGTDWAKVSAGKVVAFDSGDYNTTFPSSGALDTVNYSLTGNGSVTATQTANTLKVSTSATGQSLIIEPDQTLTLKAGGLLFTGADNYSITGGTLTGSGGTQKNLVVHQFGDGNLTVDSVIANNLAASGLVKTGTGTLTLGSANTHTGTTYVSGGALVLKNQLALQSSLLSLSNSSLVFDSSVVGNAFTLAGITTTIDGPGYDVVLENNDAIPEPVALTLNVNGLTNYFGSFSGSGSLIKEGTATLRLNGTNTFTGGIIINNGTIWTQIPGIVVQNDSYLGGGPDGPQVTVNALGTLSMNSNNITGTLTLNGGNVENASTTSTWNGSIILLQTSSFMRGGDGNLRVNAVISGIGGLSRTAARDNTRLILTNANTFTGDTKWAVTNGIFDLNHSLALQNSTLDTAGSLAGVGNVERGFQTNQTALTFGGLSGNKDLKSLFATNATAGGYNNLTALTLNPGTGTTPAYSGGIADSTSSMSLIKTGAGTQTLSGANTYTGGTTVTAGTLTIDGSLSDATATISSGTLNGTGTLTFNINGTSTDLITVTGGTFNIADLTVAINPTGAGLTESEYVLVNAPGGTILGGTFEGLTGAPGYELDYDTVGQIKLVQIPGTPFATWIGGFGLAPGDQGFNFDADGDGIGNGVEAWFGTNPSIGGPGLTQVAKSGNTVTFTHPEADPALIDVTGSYEWSLDLATWNASAATEGGTTVTIAPSPNDPAPGTTTVTATITGTEPTKVFLRAVATQP